MTKEQEDTARLGEQVYLLMQARAIRNFAKAERKQAHPDNCDAWERLYLVTFELSAQAEMTIANLLPTGTYEYLRALPKA